MTNDAAIRKNVLICDTQPVAVEGMKWLIENTGDLHFAGSVYTLEAAYEVLNPGAALAARELAARELAAAELAAAELADREAAQAAALEIEAVTPEAVECAVSGACMAEDSGFGDAVAEVRADECRLEEASVEAIASLPEDVCAFRSEPDSAPSVAPEVLSEPELAALAIPTPIDAIVIDKGLGLADVMALLHKLALTSHATPTIVWGSAISEAEALRLLQAGARGILRRTSESGTLLTCLRAVTSGGTWMEDGIFGSTEKLYNPRRSQLTHRESEVVVLVEKGLRNRDIARTLGIQTGTVKIHLKHIFEKTGVRGRYGLALTGLQSKGAITLSPPQFTV